MALKLKLGDFQKASESKKVAKIKRKKVKNIDELLERPEVSKLQELDRELTAVADDKSEPVEKRLKDYEELLASYKDVVERLKKYGSTSLLTDRSAEDDGDESAAPQLENILKREGVKFDKDRVHVLLRNDDKTRRRRSTVSYSRQTFDKVLSYVKSTSQAYATHLVRQVAKKLFDLVKDKIDVSLYPGFANISQMNSASFNGVWSRL